MTILFCFNRLIIKLANDTITYQYNKLGNLKTLIPQLGQTLTYWYDYESTDPLVKKIGRLLNIQSGTNTFTYDYTGVNPLIQELTRPNGSFTEYLYNDPLKRLTDVINKNSSQQVINSYNYTYYTSGPNTDLIQYETITNGEPIDSFVEGTTTYTPNNLNQLTSTTNPNRTYSYDYDGNMTQGYTPEGYTLTMTYDAENRMTSAQYTDSSSVTHRTEYTYGGDSLLAKQKKYENGILVNDTRYLRVGFLPVQERDASNAINREYVWGLNLGGGIGGLLSLKQNNQDYAYLYDGKGNVSALLDSTQTVVANYRYDPFGVVMKKTATIEQPYMFSTKQYDEKLGLIDYGFRRYMPEAGKWLTRDPLGESGGINLYKFTDNSAMNWLDPFGLEIRVYSSNAFGIPGLNHAFVYSTEINRGKGRAGKSEFMWGTGVGDLNSPYIVVPNLNGMSESEFITRIEAYPGWNQDIWLPWYDDCHSELEDAFNYVGVTYPKAPNERIDIDDIVVDATTNAWQEISNTWQYLKSLFSNF